MLILTVKFSSRQKDSKIVVESVAQGCAKFDVALSSSEFTEISFSYKFNFFEGFKLNLDKLRAE